MNNAVKPRLFAYALFAFVVFALCAPAVSQSCSLCYTQASSAGQRMIQALRSGILILIIPPTLASVGLIFVVHHKRNQVRRTDEDENSGQEWQ